MIYLSCVCECSEVSEMSTQKTENSVSVFLIYVACSIMIKKRTPNGHKRIPLHLVFIFYMNSTQGTETYLFIRDGIPFKRSNLVALGYLLISTLWPSLSFWQLFLQRSSDPHHIWSCCCRCRPGSGRMAGSVVGWEEECGGKGRVVWRGGKTMMRAHPSTFWSGDVLLCSPPQSLFILTACCL